MKDINADNKLTYEQLEEVNGGVEMRIVEHGKAIYMRIQIPGRKDGPLSVDRESMRRRLEISKESSMFISNSQMKPGLGKMDGLKINI